MLKKWDVIIISIILALGILCLGLFNLVFIKGSAAVVYVNNRVVDTLPLNKNTQKNYDLTNGYNLVVVKNGYVYVKQADCKNQICVNTKKANKKGSVITCAPHKFLVEVK